MDAFVDFIALISMPGILCVAIGPGLLGALMPMLLVLGIVEDAMQPSPLSATHAVGEPDGSRTTT